MVDGFMQLGKENENLEFLQQNMTKRPHCPIKSYLVSL